MPQLKALGRHWNIASDDVAGPTAISLLFRCGLLAGFIVFGILHYANQIRDIQPTRNIGIYLLCHCLVLTVTSVVEVALIINSLKGAIMNEEARKWVPTLIKVRVFLFPVEVLIITLGSYLALQIHLDSTHPVVIALRVMIGASWILLFAFVVLVLLLFDPLGTTQPSDDPADYLDENSYATRIWNLRMKAIGFLARSDEMSSFLDIARLLQEFYLDINLVPSDIAAGLTLLYAERSLLEKQERQILLDGASYKPGDETMANIKHYVRYATSIYGWLNYTYSNPCRCITEFCCTQRCCCLGETRVAGDYFGINMDTFIYRNRIKYEDIVYANFTNSICQSPFVVSLDHKTKALVVTVRGSLSIPDIITDLSVDVVHIPGYPETHRAHKGFLNCTKYVLAILEEENIFKNVFDVYPQYSLVLVGHSLGGGIVSLMGLLLKDSPYFNRLTVYAFSVPGSVCTPEACHSTLKFQISVTIENDIVSRLSLRSVRLLNKDILRVLNQTKQHKYHVFLKGCCFALKNAICFDDKEKSPKALISNPNDTPITDLSPDFPSSCGKIMKILENELWPPGRILMIHRIYENANQSPNLFHRFRKKPKFAAQWVSNESFSRIVVTPYMVVNHLPDSLDTAISECDSYIIPESSIA